jgi:imidazole glycerol phosphate synthase glutamine amidotransferase subunit
MSANINLLALNCSNWRSVYAALQVSGKTANILKSNDINNVNSNSILIIPGVGHISALMNEINKIISINELLLLIKQKNIKIIGICLGFHFLCSKSHEDSSNSCLNIYNKIVEPLYNPPKPSVGWKSVNETGLISSDFSIKIKNILNNNLFYFTHSYGVPFVENYEDILNIWSYTPTNSKKQIAAIFTDRFIAFQFHPEKSGSAGISLLSYSIDHLNESFSNE